jgi:hypothetical protein
MTMKFVSFRYFNEWLSKVCDFLTPVTRLYYLFIPRRSYLPALPTGTLLSLIAFRSRRSGARLQRRTCLAFSLCDLPVGLTDCT